MLLDDSDRDALFGEWERDGFAFHSTAAPKTPSLAEVPVPIEIPTPGWGAWPAVAGILLGILVASLIALAFQG